jgi:hypothetical protein
LAPAYMHSVINDFFRAGIVKIAANTGSSWAL